MSTIRSQLARHPRVFAGLSQNQSFRLFDLGTAAWELGSLGIPGYGAHAVSHRRAGFSREWHAPRSRPATDDDESVDRGDHTLRVRRSRHGTRREASKQAVQE